MRRAATVFVLVAGVLVSVTLALNGENGNADDPWEAVKQAMEKGLPKTAIAKLEPILEQAKQEQNWDTAVKAVGLKIALEGNIQGNKAEEKIVRMEQAIAGAPAEMRPVMHAILAHWYWHYFLQNRWRIMRRTQTAAPSGDDVRSWSPERMLEEIHDQLQAALAAEKRLKKTPVADFQDLLAEGTMPDAYRPTMYDFLVHEALEFYSSGESYVVKPEDDYELPASSPIFGSVEEFMAWDPEGDDSWTLEAIRLYQDLLDFHKDDKNRTAFLAASLDRLHFGDNRAVGDAKSALYKAALERFAEDHREHELASRAYYLWASELRSDGELVKAHERATQGENLHPKSVFGKKCHNLIAQIEAKSFRVSTERVWNEPLPTIDITYKNLRELHFRIVAADWDKLAAKWDHRPEGLDHPGARPVLSKEPVKSWSVDLPATTDYKLHIEQRAVPKELEPGFYYLIASGEADFGSTDNQVQYTAFWVSDLALIVRSDHDDGVLGGLVLDALTGEPIAGARVELWRWNDNHFFPSRDATTDANGLYRFGDLSRGKYTVQVTHDGQELVSVDQTYPYHFGAPPPDERTVFFTDRSIYRPGQTIHYKGISFLVDQANNNYEVLDDRRVTVVLLDNNGEEIARQEHTTNDYGSFSGSFTAPRGRLTGYMRIRVEGEPSGNVSVRVEEYKRPKFQVELEPPEKSPKLGTEVTMTGTATAYTGAPIDGATVQWRVVRSVRFPYWWSWYHWPRTSHGNQEIAHGTTTTDAQGRFQIPFTAKPDADIPEEGEPVFSFAVTAVVTDSAGETRTDAYALRVGYAAISATLSADDWQTTDEPVDVTVATQTLGGQSQEAQGVVKIHSLDPPDEVHRKPLRPNYSRRRGDDAERDLSDPKNWPLGEIVAKKEFSTGASGTTELSFKLKAGAYQVVLESQDRFGHPVKARLVFKVIDTEAEEFALNVPFLFNAPEWTLQPGDTFTAVWGSGYETARAYIEVEHRDELLQAFWTDGEKTQVKIEQKITEKMRGGFTVRVTMVRENRAYIVSHHVVVPWTNKQLTVKWERFVSKLKPGQHVTWTAVISGPEGKEEETERAVAEMVATLYDASLDAFYPHSWMESFNSIFRRNYARLNSRFENQMEGLRHLHGRWRPDFRGAAITYDGLPQSIVGLIHGYEWFEQSKQSVGKADSIALYSRVQLRGLKEGVVGGYFAAPTEGPAAAEMPMSSLMARRADRSAGLAGRKSNRQNGPDLSDVAVRENLNATAYFFPHLISGEDGKVRIEFTMPEALTEWKFMAFAHDAKLRSGFLSDRAVTSKDLMIQPNPPRFVRSGDELEFTVKVTNQSDAAQQGVVRLTFRDARTEEPRTAALGIDESEVTKPFDVPAAQSRSYSWRLNVSDDLGFLVYTAVGATADGSYSDGEEDYLPVLPRRILVTESIQLPIRGPETKTIDFEHLLNSKKSQTLKHQSLTVEMASNPAWYAVMALPYLMEYPHQCSEQVFNRLYANSLGAYIVNSDPKIARIFEQWRGTDALDSPLLKNQDIKNVMIEETPWLLEAKNESQARRRVGLLFEENRLNAEIRRAMHQLSEMQYDDGAWPWFPGGPPNDFLTLYITTGFGRLRHLGVEVNVAPAVKALGHLDNWINEEYHDIKEDDRDGKHLTPTIAFYLYGRSFFLDDRPIPAEAQEAVAYFREQAKKYWLQVPCRMSQAHIALALHRFGDDETPRAIMKSIKERSVTDEELGMFWRELERSWWWYRAPIETQAVMIEAFAEITHDEQAVKDCQVWLLKQKQTTNWQTTKATADAVYALLLQGGTDRLASDALVEVTLGEKTIEPENVEAGTGYYRQRIAGPRVKPSMGHITVKKVDEGVAWGGVHWQYFQDIGKIPATEGTPLDLEKTLWIRENTKEGPVLKPLEGKAHVGDELVVRLVLRADRDMEYVHLKDQRPSGGEPTDVLSRYKYRDGLRYYQSTRDTASHFFIDYLPKGAYVFEYSSYIVHRGRYQSGIASIECLYAPEFKAHSKSVAITVE